MRIHSDSFDHRQPIPAQFALGAPGGFGGNRNPHLAWDDAPAGTRSFALLCIDTDAPTDGALVANAAVPIPVAHPRGDFVHWAPAGRDAGGLSGRNDYTGWFAGDAQMGGDYFGYDGPYPPPHDLRVHRYFFRVFALDVATLDLPADFTAADLFRAMHGHVLAEASTYGTYSLNG